MKWIQRIVTFYGSLALSTYLDMLVLGAAHSLNSVVPAFGFLTLLCIQYVLMSAPSLVAFMMRGLND